MAVATGTAILAAAALGIGYQAHSSETAKHAGAAKEARAQEDSDIALRGLENQELVSEEQKKQAGLRARQKGLRSPNASTLYPGATPVATDSSISQPGGAPLGAGSGSTLLGS